MKNNKCFYCDNYENCDISCMKYGKSFPYDYDSFEADGNDNHIWDYKTKQYFDRKQKQ